MTIYKFNSQKGQLRTLRDHGGGSVTIEGKSTFLIQASGMLGFEHGPTFHIGGKLGIVPFENRIVTEFLLEYNKDANMRKVTVFLRDEENSSCL